MVNQEKLSDLLSEHAGWQNQILNFKAELKAMKDELGTIVSRFTPREVPASAEHFQNQFILQRDVLDIMRHDFKQFENKVEDAQKGNNEVSEYLSQMRVAYNTRLADYDKIYHELKNEFEVFKKQDIVPA